jgi:phage/plasmid-associated DNA primase
MSTYADIIAKHIRPWRTFDSQDSNVMAQPGIHCRAGKWLIPTAHYDGFLNILAAQLIAASTATPPIALELHYREKPHPTHNYLKFDLDMLFPYSNDTGDSDSSTTTQQHKYTLEFISSFIDILKQTLVTIIGTTKNYAIYVLEKHSPKLLANTTGASSKKQQVKDGLHIQIPHLILPNPIIHYIRSLLVESTELAELFTSIGNLNSIDDTIDCKIIDIAPWTIYGCGKPADKCDYYTVTCYYTLLDLDDAGGVCAPPYPQDDDVTVLPSTITDYIHLFSNSKVSPDDVCTTIDMNAIPTDALAQYTRGTSNGRGLLQQHTTSDKRLLKSNAISRRSCSMASKEILPLMECIHPHRADTYTDWWNIGVALYNMDDRNFTIWNTWSSRSPNYDADSCYKQWYYNFPKCEKYAMGLHTLKTFAKSDNPDLFNSINNLMRNQFIHKWIIAHVREPHIDGISIDTFANHVKIYISDYAKYKIVCADPSSHGVWYKFKGHIWKLDKASNEIYLTMARELKQGFLEARAYICTERSKFEQSLQQSRAAARRMRQHNAGNGGGDSDSGADDDGDDTADTDNRITNEDFINNRNASEDDKKKAEFKECSKYCDIIDNFLSTVLNKEKVIKDLSQKCYDDEFMKNLNENRDVFVCRNGTLDLTQLVFRDGLPTDMSTITCGVDFPNSGTGGAQSPHVIGGYGGAQSPPIDIEMQIQDFLDKIFPDPDIQTYVLNLFAEKLSGHNRKEQFIICTGSGSNGKSQFFKLIQKVFGEYYGTFDNSLLNTPKKDANSASPAIASLKGIRLAFTTEPKNGLGFETDKLKELIGGDELVGRHLRQDLIRFIPQYLMGMMCNDIPEMPSTDDGVWRKVYVIPFVSKFIVKDDEKFKLTRPADFPNHFPAENKEQLYPTWAPYLLRMLFHRYCEISRNNFYYSVPETVTETTRKYKMESNIYSQFFTECLTYSPGCSIPQTDLFTHFREYVTAGNYNSKVNKKTFITHIERFVGKCSKSGLYSGFSIIDKQLSQFN